MVKIKETLIDIEDEQINDFIEKNVSFFYNCEEEYKKFFNKVAKIEFNLNIMHKSLYKNKGN
jgi:hypothetical protein